MMNVRWICLGVVLLLGGSPAWALKIGDTAGNVALSTLDGHPRVMNNYAEHQGTVVAFLSARCAATDSQIQRLNALAGREESEEMVFVGVCSNPEETGEELRTFCHRRGVVFPVYRDPDASVAKQFGAKTTPEFFLLDGAGKLIYRGHLDGLQAAITALLADQPVLIKQTAAEGTSLRHPGRKREIDDLYSPIQFSSELVFSQIPGAVVYHCSTIAEAANGDLLCLWYGGSYESAEDQVLFLARQARGDRSWSVPEVVERNPDQPPGNAVIFQDADQRLWMIWGRMKGSRPTRRGTGWTDCSLVSRISTDNGMTWGEDREWPDSAGWLPRNPPILLKSGALVLPMSVEANEKTGGALLRLNPDKATWARLGVMDGGEQMTLIERSTGELFALARSKPRLISAESRDGGETWSTPMQSDLKCPDSASVMIRLRSGRLLLAHNDNDGEDRATLALEQSEDEGRTWGDKKILEMEPRLQDGEYSYPCLIQSSDGLIHITYTYRRYSIMHAAFNEAWLTQLVRPN